MKIKSTISKIFSIIISFTMLFSVLSGCSFKKESENIVQILSADGIISSSLENGTSRFLFGNLAGTGVVRNEA